MLTRKPIKKVLLQLGMIMCSAAFLTNCAIADLSSDTTRNVMIDKSANHTDVTPNTNYQSTNQDVNSANLNVSENTTIRVGNTTWGTHTGAYNSDALEPLKVEPPKVDIDTWLDAVPNRRQEAQAYQRYLSQMIGANNIPPLSQLLVTARDWYKCGFEPYEIPPRHLWHNNVETLRLYALLKQRGIFPPSTEIRSAYRNEALNQCAEGAATSRHVSNGAIDVWVPEYEDRPWAVHDLQDRLCIFRLVEGETYNFGLGLYSTNSYHIDTHRVRIWGGRHTRPDSPCRIPIELTNTD